MIAEVQKGGRKRVPVTNSGSDWRRALQSSLHCPYCGSTLDLNYYPDHSSNATRSDSFAYGIMRCSCYEYPIVEGIPILQHVAGINRIVALIEAGRSKEALLQAFATFRMDWAHHTVLQRYRYARRCEKLVASHDASFADATRWLRQPKVFADYLFHRYANLSFLAAVGPMTLLGALVTTNGSSGIFVLDMGCGTGHSSFLINYLFPQLNVVCVDQDFANLYLAKRFMTPQALHLCLDAEVPSPFIDEYFDAVFCLDAFHYLDSKRAVVSELRRVVKSNGIWLFPHLHNALKPNVTPGIPLPPDRYLACFDPIDARLFDEFELIRELSGQRVVDIEERRSMGELEASQVLTLIAGPHHLWRKHYGFPDQLIKDDQPLKINPIYRVRRQGNAVDLALEWPNATMRFECREAESILPKSYRFRAQDICSLLNTGSFDRARLEELVSKFILVALPENYEHRNSEALTATPTSIA